MECMSKYINIYGFCMNMLYLVDSEELLLSYRHQPNYS